MRRILHFRWIKGVLRLRRRRGKRSRFSCWAWFYAAFLCFIVIRYSGILRNKCEDEKYLKKCDTVMGKQFARTNFRYYGWFLSCKEGELNIYILIWLVCLSVCFHPTIDFQGALRPCPISIVNIFAL